MKTTYHAEVTARICALFGAEPFGFHVAIAELLSIDDRDDEGVWGALRALRPDAWRVIDCSGFRILQVFEVVDTHGITARVETRYGRLADLILLCTEPRCRFVMTVVHAGRIIHICDQEMVDWTLDRPKVQLNESCHADLAPFLGPR